MKCCNSCDAAGMAEIFLVNRKRIQPLDPPPRRVGTTPEGGQVYLSLPLPEPERQVTPYTRQMERCPFWDAAHDRELIEYQMRDATAEREALVFSLRDLARKATELADRLENRSSTIG